MTFARPQSLFLVRGAIWPAVCIALIAYFAFHAILGNSGLLSLPEYRAQQKELRVKAQYLAERRENLTHKVALLSTKGADPDLAEEMIRENLGLVRPDEVVVPLPKGD